MELRDYITTLQRRFWLILGIFVLTVAIVTVGTFLITPTYLSTTVIRVATGASASAGVSTGSNDIYYADRLLNTYLIIATSGPVLDQVIKETGLEYLPKVAAEIIPNTELFQISVEDKSPFTAQAVAEKIAVLLVSQSQQFYMGGGKSPEEVISEQLSQLKADVDKAQNDYDLLVSAAGSNPAQIESAGNALTLIQNIYYNLLSQYEQIRLRAQIQANTVSIIEPATFPLKPDKPNKLINIALGCMVGLFGGVGLAFLLENLKGTREPNK
jgi:uncharacterized protein involved in exopolysaccharide biosynthesis